MIDITNLDQNTKLHIESVARGESDDKKMHSKQLDKAIRRMVSDDIAETNEVLEMKDAKSDEGDSENETLLIRQQRGRWGRCRYNQRSSRSGYRGRYPNTSKEKMRCHNSGSDKHLIRFCDKPIKQSEFTGVVQKQKVSDNDPKDDSFDVFDC